MEDIRQNTKKGNPILFVVSGMVLATIITGLCFYILDKTKGWNPYGWWFMATFASAILGGIAGIFIFGYKNKNKQ
jgi:hypothetical protein